jgi:hypothetical protein
MGYAIGMQFDEWLSAAELTASGKGFGLGDRVTTHDGKVYVYVKLSTGGVTGDGYVCSFGNDYLALMVETDTAASILEGDWVGVAEGAGAVDEYGWLQVAGPCGIRTEQDALANKKLGPTADAGQLDDAAATGIFINGIHLGTATGGADAVNTTGFLNYPTLEVRMEPETT